MEPHKGGAAVLKRGRPGTQIRIDQSWGGWNTGIYIEGSQWERAPTGLDFNRKFKFSDGLEALGTVL